MDKAFDINGEELHVHDKVLETWEHSPFYNQVFEIVKIDSEGMVYYSRQEFSRLSCSPSCKLKKVESLYNIVSKINNELNS